LGLAKTDPYPGLGHLHSIDRDLGQVRRQDLKAVIIAPMASYTVDGSSVQESSFDQQKWGQIQIQHSPAIDSWTI
jgi:hypothetical protein